MYGTVGCMGGSQRSEKTQDTDSSANMSIAAEVISCTAIQAGTTRSIDSRKPHCIGSQYRKPIGAQPGSP